MENDLKKLISLLSNHNKGIIISKSEFILISDKVKHYFQEIVRYWNQINYIFKKTSRSVGNGEVARNLNESCLHYAIYRIEHENASINQVITELGQKNNRNLAHFLEKVKTFSWAIALKNKSQIERVSIKKAVPSFFIERLLEVIKIKEVIQIIDRMNSIAPDDKFTFLILSTKEESDIIENLSSQTILNYPDPHVPHLYFSKNKDKAKLILSNSYKQGKILLLDKSSAIVSLLMNIDKSDLVWDTCVAPGIKVLSISTIFKQDYRVIGGDFSLSRLYQSYKLFLATRFKNILLCNMDSILPPFRYKEYFDKILIDAPCSGSGTFQTNPELKWKQSSYFLKTTQLLQEKLLATALDYLKPDGILIYSTCSLYPEEGELQILKFLDQLEPMQIPKWIDPSYVINGKRLKGTGRLFPHKQHSQGFFIGKFKKKVQ